ncbi:MAG: hypothetical protein H8D23_08110, partial [Candidatus Brocadiales bacterium]|nr:hypothetical protein [Candidatus Brocadiales bacterium]
MPTWNEAENKLKETGFKKTSYRPGNNFQDSAIKTDHTYNTKEASSQAKASTEVTKDKNINNVKVNKKTDVSNKNKTAVQDQPSSPSKGNSKTIHAATEKRIEAQLSKKFEEKFKKKEEQLKRDLKKNSLQEPSHYIRKSIEEIKSSEVKKDHFCSFGESKLTPKQLYDTLS